MSRRSGTPAKRKASSAAASTSNPQSSTCVITACRGCCCGTSEAVPGFDHAAQLARLRAATAPAAPTASTTQTTPRATVRVSTCLDACEQANVIVVQPSPAGRAAGGRPVWLGLANDHDVADDIAAWVAAGGPGLADMPGVLDLYVFSPSRKVREALGS